MESNTATAGYYLGANGMSWPTDIITDDGKELVELIDSTLYVNLETVIRNALNAFEFRDDIGKASVSIVTRVEEDIGLLRNFMENNLRSKVVVYWVNYANVKIKGMTSLVVSKTDKAKAMDAVSKTALDGCKHLVDVSYNSEFSNSHANTTAKTFILTHIAADLIKSSTFPSLSMIQSYTGSILKSSNFNHKLKIDKSLREFIPLTPITLRIFGDKEMFAPLPLKTRKAVEAIAVKSNWSPVTTESRVMFSINRLDKPLYDILRNMT